MVVSDANLGTGRFGNQRARIAPIEVLLLDGWHVKVLSGLREGKVEWVIRDERATCGKAGWVAILTGAVGKVPSGIGFRIGAASDECYNRNTDLGTFSDILLSHHYFRLVSNQSAASPA